MSVLRPLTLAELQQRTSEAAVSPAPSFPARHSLYVVGDSERPPNVSASVTEVPALPGTHTYRIDIEPEPGSTFTFGLPSMPYRTIRRGGFSAPGHAHATSPHRPDHVPMTYVPAVPRPAKRFRQPRLMLKDKLVRPLEIFPPDRRQQLTDFSYPWGTTGRTVSPVGDGTVKVASGTLVGPRHLLTASHCIGWQNPAGPSVSFAPGFSNVPGKIGTANGIYGYSYRYINEQGDQLDVSEDYVVVVLDQRMGDALGWMGTLTYSNDWDNDPYFYNIGYSSDLGHGLLPFWQGSVSFEDADNPGIFGQEGDGLYMDTESASVTTGNSGGPFFDYFTPLDPSFTAGWYIVSVVSAEGTLDWTFDDDNWAAGGSPMPDLVNEARNDYP
jgi:V8-like Glu-specific endopeptidase